MNKTVQINQSVPVKYKVDVCVAGGGPAGVAAAVSAAGNGAKVFIGESCGCFGGLGTCGLVPAFCGVGNGKRFLGGSICRKVFDIMQIPSGELEREFSFIDVEKLKCTYDKMIIASNVQYAFEVKMIAVNTENGVVKNAIFADGSDSGLFAVEAKVFIDCTGNGDLAVRAGAYYTQGNAKGIPMPSSLCSLWNNVDWDEYKKANVNLFQLLLQAIDDGVFKEPDWHHSGMFPVGNSLAGGNFSHAFGIRANEHQDTSAAWMDLRRKLEEFKYFYNKYVPGFSHAELCMSASLLGVRECRRIIGDYIMTIDDFNARRRFDDEIGQFAYPVDIHPLDATKGEFERFQREFYGNLRYKDGECYGIPYRILIPAKLHNVLTAGRCVSTDQQMAASIRVMPGCFLTGEAAGCAAAMASATANGEVRNISIPVLQNKLGISN